MGNLQMMADHGLQFLLCSLIIFQLIDQIRAEYINFTYLESAVPKGAVCLDGSPPAYSYAKGSGTGANNWIVYLEGGGWCETKAECVERSKGKYGSSYSRDEKREFFGGILGGNQKFNPDFYNWNRIYVVYCDGSSFMSDIEEIDQTTNLTFRGARIFDAVMEDLLAKGMKNADNVILAGGSAGGLATILHCDIFRALVPNASRVKCISDSGFFIHAETLPGTERREQRFRNVVATHGLANLLPASCTSEMDPGLCLFPENLVNDIRTPLFVLESAFDLFQIEENLITSLGGKAKWSDCTTNFALCTSSQLQIMKNFRATFIDTLLNLDNTESRGMFVHSCYRHGHIHQKDGWSCSNVVGNNVLENKTIGQAIGDWYFDRSWFQHIDTVNDMPRNCTNTLTPGVFDKECACRL